MFRLPRPRCKCVCVCACVCVRVCVCAQVAAAKHAIRMLGGVLDACEKELARLKMCR